MLDYDDALNTLLLEALTLRSTSVVRPIAQCHAHRLAAEMRAQYPSPTFTNSAMDGYALHIDDTNMHEYRIIGRIAAGDDASDLELASGQAVRIFTGTPLPKGCNAVIAQEQTECDGQTLRCTRPPILGEHIRIQGEDFTQGSILLKQGDELTPARIGLLASQGYAQIPVYTPLRVTVFSSGNEVLEPTQTLHSGTIFDANRYQLMAWLRTLHCDVVDGGILPDDLVQTRDALHTHAPHCDLILTSGGASVGEEDHLTTALQQLGELTQWKLAIKPGKPFAWGRIGDTPVMILPGNPVASFVTFKILVEPVLRTRMGALIEHARPKLLYARAHFSISALGNRREFLRGMLWHDPQGIAHVDVLSNQGSHMLSACAQANCLIAMAPMHGVTEGEYVPVMQL